MADRWLVIGLGNPGPEYEKTRHNIGQLVLDQLSDGQKFSSHKSRMEICEVKCGEQTLVLAKSRGYMNETGGPPLISCSFLFFCFSCYVLLTPFVSCCFL